MKKRFGLVAAWILSLFLALAGCGNPDGEFAGKVYTYEGEGFGGDFTISIFENGSFTYYEGGFSSYIGGGEWSLVDGALALSETGQGGEHSVNYFRVEGNTLRFVQEGSRNYPHVELENGAAFQGAPLPSKE